MSRILFFISLCLFFVLPVQSQRTVWTKGTARTVPKGMAEFGILHPLQFGISDDMEISTSPLLNLSFAPNVSVKKKWHSGIVMVSSRHAFINPTMLFDALSRKGWLDIMSPDTNNPHVYKISNEVLASVLLGPETVLTASAGIDFGLKWGDTVFQVIEKPFWFQHTAPFREKVNWNIGLDLDGNIHKRWNYSFVLDFISVGMGVDYWAIENKGMIIWNQSTHFAALAGYALSYGKLPNGNDFGILPMIDLVWKINPPPKQPDRGLYRKKPF